MDAAPITLQRPRPLFIWGETVALTLLPVALGLWLRPSDPLWARGPFPWIVLAPLLCGLRHGFAQGLGSALLLAVALALELRLLGRGAYPATLAVGVALTGMLSGEFCDVWTRRMHRAMAIEDYSRRRLEEFTRAYHLLRASHLRLEQQLARGVSLRTALDRLRRLAGRAPSRLAAQQMLELLAEFVPLQAASLFEVEPGGELQEIGRLGPPGPADLMDHPVVREALRSRRLQRPAAGAAPLQAAVPLTDTSGALRGLLLVQEMPRGAGQGERLELLAVLGGHLGDLLAGDEEAALERRVRRCLEDARQGLPSMALGLIFAESTPAPLPELVLAERRALDHAELRAGRDGNPVVLLVMPLTDPKGLDGFLGRLERLLQERHGGGVRELGLTVRPFPIESGHDAVRLVQQLYEACEIEEHRGFQEVRAHAV